MKKCLTYFCVVEGQQEELYLKHVAKLLTDFPNRIVKFNIAIGNANELKKSGYEYTKACLFDYDFNKIEFEYNLNTCITLSKKRKKSDSKIFHAYSNACFDLWLLLHKKPVNYTVTKATDYVKDIRKTYSLVDEADIKSEKEIQKILTQIGLDDIKEAISRAENIRSMKLPIDKIMVSHGEYYFDNPDFSIDIFLKQVLKESGVFDK